MPGTGFQDDAVAQDSAQATKARKIVQPDLTIRQGWDLAQVKARYLAMGHQVNNVASNTHLHCMNPLSYVRTRPDHHHASFLSDPLVFSQRPDQRRTLLVET